MGARPCCLRHPQISFGEKPLACPYCHTPGPLVPWEEGQALGHTHFCSAWIPRVAVETLGIPCFLTGMARGLLGRNHPLHFRQNRRAALKKADVVVLAGGPGPPTLPPFPLPLGTSLPV